MTKKKNGVVDGRAGEDGYPHQRCNQRGLVTGKERFGSESEGGTLHVHIVICLRAMI